MAGSRQPKPLSTALAGRLDRVSLASGPIYPILKLRAPERLNTTRTPNRVEPSAGQACPQLGYSSE